MLRDKICYYAGCPSAFTNLPISAHLIFPRFDFYDKVKKNCEKVMRNTIDDI